MLQTSTVQKRRFRMLPLIRKTFRRGLDMLQIQRQSFTFQNQPFKQTQSKLFARHSSASLQKPKKPRHGTRTCAPEHPCDACWLTKKVEVLSEVRKPVVFVEIELATTHVSSRILRYVFKGILILPSLQHLPPTGQQAPHKLRRCGGGCCRASRSSDIQ